MRRLICLAAVVLMLGGIVSRVGADPTVTLSSPVDLMNLMVGDIVPIHVNLEGLPTNDFIFVLDTRILFDTSLFKPLPDPANSSGLTPGTIFIATSQINSFNSLSSLTAGSANGNFSDLAPQPSVAINQNGLYYTFDLQAITTGSGSIRFDTSGNSYAADDTGFNLAPLPTGSPLTVTITAVPEASTPALLVATGLNLVGLIAWAAIKSKGRRLRSLVSRCRIRSTAGVSP